jgi:hypothetical protein
MEDEHQSTLKKKIQILFQLGKWPDVIKLCASYNEQYGKDMEIDMLRFKSERHLGIGSPAPGEKPPEPKPAAEAERPLAAIMNAEESAAPPAAEEAEREEAAAFEPAAAEEISIGEPFSENELIIDDPFADDGPGFSLAPDEPPVELSANGTPEPAIAPVAALEMEGPADESSPPAEEEKEIDFSKFPGMAIDAEPELLPSQPKETVEGPVPDAREEEKLADLFRATPSPRMQIVEEPKEEMAPVAPPPPLEEKPRPTGSLFSGAFEAEAEKRTFALHIKVKHVLMVLLPLVVAGTLWLALSGRLNLTGSPEEVTASQPVIRHPPGWRPPLPIPEPKQRAPVPETPSVEQLDRAFAEKFNQAEELSRKGDLLKAWAVLLEAKKIKVTEPLRLLEEQLANKIRAAEEKASQETQVAESQMQLESEAFARAEAANTIPTWQEFMRKYPDGELAQRAGRRIAQLEKKAQEDSQQALALKIRQLQRVRPRADYQGMNQADVTAMLRQLGRPPTQFEVHEHGGTKVLLDFASGLMWTLWNKPMVYDKAKWWANRVTAGYSGWRLPSAEEALSLLQMDRDLYAGLPDFAVWTGDTVSDQPHTVWALKIPEGQFLAVDYEQSYYVWAVRKASR